MLHPPSTRRVRIVLAVLLAASLSVVTFVSTDAFGGKVTKQFEGSTRAVAVAKALASRRAHTCGIRVYKTIRSAARCRARAAAGKRMHAAVTTVATATMPRPLVPGTVVAQPGDLVFAVASPGYVDPSAQSRSIADVQKVPVLSPAESFLGASASALVDPSPASAPTVPGGPVAVPIVTVPPSLAVAVPVTVAPTTPAAATTAPPTAAPPTTLAPTTMHGSSASTSAAPTTAAPTTAAPTTAAPIVTTPPPAVGLNTIVLSPSGSDDNPGTVDRPRRTLPKEPGSGTTYLFRGGTYGDISVDWTGAVGVTLASFPGEQAILDGGSRYGSFLILRDGSRGVTVRGLTVTRYNDSYGNGSIDAYGDVGPVSILGNTFTSNGSDPVLDHHIYLGPGSAQGRIHDWLIQGNRFLNPSASSIHSYGTNGAVGITVSNNRFVGGNWGIIISEEGQRDWDIVGNTFSGIASVGVELATYATGAPVTGSNIRLSRNVFVSPAGAFALRVDKSFVAARSLIEDTNLYWAGGAAPILWSYPGPGHVLHLAEFRAASGMGSGSVEIDPRLDAQDIATNSAAIGYGAS